MYVLPSPFICGPTEEVAWLFNSHFRSLDSRKWGDQQGHVSKVFLGVLGSEEVLRISGRQKC